MRTLAAVCAGVAVISGIVAVILWGELRTERLENVALRSQLADTRLAGQQAPPPQSVATIPAATAVAAPAQSTKPAETPAKTPLPPANIASVLGLAGVGSTADLMKDPEYRKARLTQLRMEMARNYPGLVEELGLSEQESRQLFDIMAESSLNMTTQITSGNAAETMELMRRQGETQTAAIRNLLGEARYAQYTNEYMPTRAARTRAATMGSSLTAAGVPLTDGQARALTNTMIAEDRRQKQEAPPPRPIDPANANRPSLTQSLTDSQNRQSETNRRVLEAAASVLSARQLETLTKQFEQQDAQSRSTLARLTQDLDAAAARARPASAGSQ